MRHVYLSHHAGRIADGAASDYRAAAEALKADIEAARRAEKEYAALLDGKPWWRRLLNETTRDEREQRALMNYLYIRAEETHELAESRRGDWRQTLTGVDGEEQLSRWLDTLPDTWVGLHGYRNRAGEIDVVVVGPGGVWAIEVKARNAIVYIEGDVWRFRKRDRRGNIVTGGKATDGGGRSWSKQVNQPANLLARWLERNGHTVRIRTSVMLMHPRAEVRFLRDRTVDVVSTLAEGPDRLLSAITKRSAILDEPARDEVVRLITRDHRYQAHRRR